MARIEEIDIDNLDPNKELLDRIIYLQGKLSDMRSHELALRINIERERIRTKSKYNIPIRRFEDADVLKLADPKLLEVFIETLENDIINGNKELATQVDLYTTLKRR